ncbi:MAG TPA: iron chelate uptake ABC transporter family permease subunit [Pirellulaceae bacterium]|nr:iron chelate uptake ABC transporter family permease subunit [Pirellulaceae bacterium]
MSRTRFCAALSFLICVHVACVAVAQPRIRVQTQGSIADRSIEWPTWNQWRRVLLLEDYNTRVVLLGTTLLGGAAGMVGSFTLLRKRALMGDALSHATLPGIGLAFMFVTAAGGNGKSLANLLLGATISGLVGVGGILLIRNLTRIKEDAALGVVLSVFFGAGLALLSVAQRMPEGNAAGLEGFIYGKTASMVSQDAWLIAAAAVACIFVCLLLFKEFKLLCFDEGFAGSRGFPIVSLDLALMALIVIVTIVGLQAVGLILMIALLVIPAAAARFWTESMGRMVAVSAVLGAAGGQFGAALSALFSKLPSGAMIVLVCAAFFVFSLIFGSARGVVIRGLRRARLNRNVERQHLLRAIYEALESSDRLSAGGLSLLPAVEIADLLPRRSWSQTQLLREIRRAERDRLVERAAGGVRLTQNGMGEAARLTRQHRLWELFLITHADIAASQVDRAADDIEHVLEPEVIAELESLLAKSAADIPASPHKIEATSSETPAAL